MFRSIRAKLTLWYAFILLTTLVAFGLVAYTYSSQTLADNLDQSLSNEVKWVENFIQGKISKVKPSKKFTSQQPVAPSAKTAPTPEEVSEADELVWNQIYAHALLNPKKTIIEVTNKWGAIAFRTYTVEDETLSVGEVPLNTIKIQTLRNVKGMNLRVAATRTNDLDIYVAYPLSELTEALENLFSIFLILIPVALAVSVGGGWLLAYKSLKPVDEITRAAREITAQHLDRQIPQTAADDEIGRLISTFNGMILRLRQSFEQVRQFSADASHELRTPLTIMRGEVELALRHPKEPGEYRRVLSSNLEEIVRLSAIIDNLLTVSRADIAQPGVPAEEQVDLHELVDALYGNCEAIARKKEIDFRLGRNDKMVVRGNKIQLRQLLMNLIDNAIKYTPVHGTVTLNSLRQEGVAKISVTDTGIGIPGGDLEKIFHRFYRVDKARSREMGGTGLGLSIAKWIAELHRGRIEVQSQPSAGSTFTVFLPL
jgi:two-component system OmpR family sensor kinase